MSLEAMITVRLAKAFDYLAARVGVEAVYRRFKSEEYHPVNGSTKTFWEEVRTRVIPITPRQATTQLPEGIAGQVESVFAVKRSVFSLQPGEIPPILPRAGDEIEIDGEVWTSDLEGRAYYWTDPQSEIWFVAMRRAG